MMPWQACDIFISAFELNDPHAQSSDFHPLPLITEPGASVGT